MPIYAHAELGQVLLMIDGRTAGHFEKTQRLYNELRIENLTSRFITTFNYSGNAWRSMSTKR